MDGLLPWIRRSGWVYGLVAVVLALLAWRWAGDGGGGSGASASSGSVTHDVRRPVTQAEPIVHVIGEVRHPGVYRIGGDARVLQAIRLAGGPTSRANLQGLNLAAVIADGQQIIVPSKVPARATAAGGGAGGTSAAGASGQVSLSSATAADLEALDGVGPALAQRIIDWRTTHGGFSSVDQLDDVPGIGPTRLDALRPHLTP